jgi:hypothetical protein
MVTVSLTVVPSISSSNKTTTQLAFAQATAAPVATTTTTNNTSKLQEPGQPNLQALKNLIVAH